MPPGLLYRIFRVLKTAEHAIGVRLQLTAEGLEQEGERRLVAASRGLNQRRFAVFEHDR